MTPIASGIVLLIYLAVGTSLYSFLLNASVPAFTSETGQDFPAFHR